MYSSLASEDSTEWASYDDDPELLVFKDFVCLHAGGCGMPSLSLSGKAIIIIIIIMKHQRCKPSALLAT